jgi:hypothetical protein
VDSFLLIDTRPGYRAVTSTERHVTEPIATTRGHFVRDTADR